MVQKRTAAAQRTPPLGPRTIEMPPLSIRADVVPATIDDESRTVELIFTTTAPVERYDWMSDKRYLEVLSMDPAHVRLDRLNQGGPLLDSHSTWSVADLLGAVVPGSVTLVKKEGRCKARFSKREAVEPVWQDVRDGIVRSVSVGYRVYKFEESVGKGNALPVRLAVDWEPFEISMVPIPADFGAHTRGGRPADTNNCQVVGQSATRKEILMKKRTGAPADVDAPDDQRSETIDEADPGAPPAGGSGEETEPSERDAGAAAERVRVQGIRQACIAGRMTRAFEDGLIKDGSPLVDAQTRVFDELRKRVDPNGAPDPNGARGAREILVGDDPQIHVRKGIENAILHRVAPDFFKLEEIGRKYRGMTLLDVGRAMLNARGVRTTDCSKMELAGLALGLISRGGMHTTSDFPLLLADVARKTLRAAYEEAEQTFKSIGRRTTLPDFKISNRMQLGDAPSLLEVKEHGEFTRGTIVEGKEQLRLLTYGRVFAISRQALVNDDTDAFSRVPTAFGRSARTLEADLVWAQIISNPVMGDGVVLFHATHGNLDSVASVVSVASLGKGRAAMRVQKGLDGTTVLNIVPKFLSTPAALETTAATFLVQVTPATPANVNPFAGLLTPLVEPRLDANSVTAWYLFADGTKTDIIEYAYLEGEEGPMVEERIGFDIDGLEIKCRLDFGAKVIDWRGLWKNPGV